MDPAMSKYSPLASFLERHPQREVRCTFREIEHALGFTLPPAARAHRAWWSNNDSNNVMTKVWVTAGYRAEQVDMPGETVVFRRVGDKRSSDPSPDHGGGLQKINDAEMIGRILDILRGDETEAQALRNAILAALEKKRARTALDLFGSELPDEAFDGVFEHPRQKSWREVGL
jgi:hypothetical protein